MSTQLQEPDVLTEMKWSRGAVLLFLSLAGFAAQARANVTVLLEEPYSYDGALAGTGHTAIFLTTVCAETPVLLRHCHPGEHGVVISRYSRIAGYDWIAIPLVPYLYAVETPDEIPLYASPKLVAFLRDQYRRANLEEFAPDAPGGEPPKGDWYELVGSSYDRTNYGFEMKTTWAQDDAFIAWMNDRPNRSSYHFISRNCADFVRQVLNFYYPKSESRGGVADLFVSTPKHAAKSLVRYSKRHSDLELTRYVIPQVPGDVKRSRPVRGVLESVFRAKKYMAALALFHPFIAGGAASVYLVGDRFNPARGAAVFSLSGEPQPAPSAAMRRAYLKELRTLPGVPEDGDSHFDRLSWQRFVEKAQPEFDARGQVTLKAPDGEDEDVAELGVTRMGLERHDVPTELQRGLVVARLKQTLARARAPRISSNELQQDWQLLQRIEDPARANLAGSAGGSDHDASQRTPRGSD